MSQQKSKAASRNGLKPAFLNLSMLVSAPRAVIAMVRRKVSNVFMPLTTGAGKRSRELKPITTRKRIANHGMAIRLRLLVCASGSSSKGLRAAYQPTTSRTGTSIITRIILTMMAMSEISLPMALPAPTTCATSCTVEPVMIPISRNARSRIPLR